MVSYPEELRLSLTNYFLASNIGSIADIHISQRHAVITYVANLFYEHLPNHANIWDHPNHEYASGSAGYLLLRNLICEYGTDTNQRDQKRERNAQRRERVNNLVENETRRILGLLRLSDHGEDIRPGSLESVNLINSALTLRFDPEILNPTGKSMISNIMTGIRITLQNNAAGRIRLAQHGIDPIPQDEVEAFVNDPSKSQFHHMGLCIGDTTVSFHDAGNRQLLIEQTREMTSSLCKLVQRGDGGGITTKYCRDVLRVVSFPVSHHFDKTSSRTQEGALQALLLSGLPFVKALVPPAEGTTSLTSLVKTHDLGTKRGRADGKLHTTFMTVVLDLYNQDIEPKPPLRGGFFRETRVRSFAPSTDTTAAISSAPITAFGSGGSRVPSPQRSVADLFRGA